MNQKTWSAVDDYIAENLLPADTVLEAALRSNRSRGLPAIDVSPAQGKLLYLLARMNGAKRILEVGTLGGYSTIWLARALPKDGKVVTLELEQHLPMSRRSTSRWPGFPTGSTCASGRR
jgi:predicted O-methyltransferase YrrM